LFCFVWWAQWQRETQIGESLPLLHMVRSKAAAVCLCRDSVRPRQSSTCKTRVQSWRLSCFDICADSAGSGPNLVKAKSLSVSLQCVYKNTIVFPPFYHRHLDISSLSSQLEDFVEKNPWCPHPGPPIIFSIRCRGQQTKNKAVWFRPIIS
jgi:hypothetical protein